MRPVVLDTLICEYCQQMLLTRLLTEFGEPLLVVACVGNRQCLNNGKVAIVKPRRARVEAELGKEER